MAVRPQLIVMVIVAAIMSFGKMYIRDFLKEIELVRTIFPFINWSDKTKETTQYKSSRKIKEEELEKDEKKKTTKKEKPVPPPPASSSTENSTVSPSGKVDKKSAKGSNKDESTEEGTSTDGSDDFSDEDSPRDDAQVEKENKEKEKRWSETENERREKEGKAATKAPEIPEKKPEPKVPYMRSLSKYNHNLPTQYKPEMWYHQCHMFTEDELCTIEARPVLLSIAGEVFDVTKGEHHYADNGGYWFLARGDVSMGFSDLSKHVAYQTNWTIYDVDAINSWRASYHEQYIFRGRLIGDYFSEHGTWRPVKQDFEDKLDEAREVEKKIRAHREKFPSCNVRSSSSAGEVWCTDKSGGKKRDWVGLPRKILRPNGKKKQCACIRDMAELTDAEAAEEYENCASDSVSCSWENKK